METRVRLAPFRAIFFTSVCAAVRRGTTRGAKWCAPVSDGLKTTFELLAATENDAAVDVLIPALDSVNRYIQESALRTILQRHSPAGQHEIIRRLHLLDDRARAAVHQQRGNLTQGMRSAVLSAESRMAANGCEAALWFREYELMPTLVSALEDSHNANASLAATTLLSLAELLDDELSGPRDYRGQRDPLIARRNAVRVLEQSVLRYGLHRRLETVEAFLMLAPRDNITLKQILSDPMHGSYLVLLDVLRHSHRQGIMRLVLGFLDDAHAPLSVLHVLSHRTDRRFVELLLEKIGGEPSSTVQANLKRLDRFTWLEGEDLSLVDGLSEVAQHSVVQMIVASSMNRNDAMRLIEHLATGGKTIGRRAAAAALAKFTGADANTLTLRLLKDEDPQVQATAARQLRKRGIPGALTILIDLVDSPHRLVRAAARESLVEFSFKRFLGAFDMLDDDVRRSTGMLVAKIDPETLPSLCTELESPSARCRAARAGRGFGHWTLAAGRKPGGRAVVRRRPRRAGRSGAAVGGLRQPPSGGGAARPRWRIPAWSSRKRLPTACNGLPRGPRTPSASRSPRPRWRSPMTDLLNSTAGSLLWRNRPSRR